MINKNLIVSLNENVVGGDPSAVSLRSTNSDSVIVEVSVPKVAIRLSDLKEAVASIEQFVKDNPVVTPKNVPVGTTSNVVEGVEVMSIPTDVAQESQMNFEFEYGEETNSLSDVK